MKGGKENESPFKCPRTVRHAVRLRTTATADLSEGEDTCRHRLCSRADISACKRFTVLFLKSSSLQLPLERSATHIGERRHPLVPVRRSAEYMS